MLGLIAAAGDLSYAGDAANTMGANACAECHKQETEAWKVSHHYKTYREMPRSKKANEIADKMGIRRIKAGTVCLDCHYTVQVKDGKEEPVSGISCESCHSASKEWIKVHSNFSGKTILFESKAEAANRWKVSESKGMIRPRAIYELAKNCAGCHVVPQEDLVNKGGHKAGSLFELVSWSQGEVRHNTWHSKGRENTPATAARKRMLYLIGLGVEVETGMRGVAKATARKAYAFEMAKRVDRARKQLAELAKAVPNVPEIAKVVELSRSAGLRLNNATRLTGAADEIAKLLVSMTEKYDGSTLAELDRFIPAQDKFKGTARKPD